MLTKIERDNWHKYHIQNQPAYYKCKVNHIAINSGNTLSHELMKCLCCIMIAKFGDIKITKQTIGLINQISLEVEKLGFSYNQGHFITEACRDDRRVDVVNLTNGSEVEVESKSNITKEGAITIRLSQKET